MWKKVCYCILFLFLCIGGGTRAGSMTFFPSTGEYAMYCWNTGHVMIDTTSIAVSAIDSKILTHNIAFSGFSPLLPFGTYAHLGSGGTSLKSINYPWMSYVTGSSYVYVNRYASNLAQLLSVGSTGFYSFLFAGTGSQLTGTVDFYYLSGENWDDSNMQSGDVNTMIDTLTTISSGSYTFVPRPCVADIDPPRFTGYVSGASYSADVDTGFYFTIYDYTGGYRHYRFQSPPANVSNLINYVPVASYDIDNQYGVKSGSISVVLSGIAGGTLAPMVMSGLNCTLPYNGSGYPLTWDHNARGYTCFVPFSSLGVETDQIIQVIVTGADNANLYGEIHTGSIAFSFSYTFPPLVPHRGGGGGGETEKDDCPDGDFSPSYYDKTCVGEEAHEAPPVGCPIEDSPYDEELTSAYLWSYDQGITNKCPIETAQLKLPLKRKYFVKMLVYFTVKVLGVMPDAKKIGCDVYDDLQQYPDELKYYAKLGCQLEIMGMKPNGVTPMENFLPEELVTRAMFGTMLSRLIFGKKYAGSEPYRYSKHLAALKKYGIIKIVTPDLIETKGFVMLMFKRTYDSGLVEQFRLSAAAKNGATALK